MYGDTDRGCDERVKVHAVIGAKEAEDLDEDLEGMGDGEGEEDDDDKRGFVRQRMVRGHTLHPVGHLLGSHCRRWVRYCPVMWLASGMRSPNASCEQGTARSLLFKGRKITLPGADATSSLPHFTVNQPPRNSAPLNSLPCILVPG